MKKNRQSVTSWINLTLNNMFDENSRQAFEEWEGDNNSTGELDEKYISYVNRYIDSEEGGMRDMLTFEEFSRQEYDKYLLELHSEDDLDDEEDPFPGEDEDSL